MKRYVVSIDFVVVANSAEAAEELVCDNMTVTSEAGTAYLTVHPLHSFVIWLKRLFKRCGGPAVG